MLRIHHILGPLALVTTAAAGCGGNGETTGSGGQGGSTSSTTTTTATTTSSSSTTSSGAGYTTPVRPKKPTCPNKDGIVLAATKLYFGEGMTGQWKKYGFDLDGKDSNALSTDLCQPNAGGMPKNAYPDGDMGIDNSFGKNLLPVILSLYPTWTQDVNNAITIGRFTALFKLECLAQTGDLSNFETKLFGTTALGTNPKFDGTDKWPIAPELLGDPTDPESATILFEHSSVKKDVFDSGKDVIVILSVPIQTMTNTSSIKLTLHSARVTMNLSADRKSAVGGMIGGVLNTEEFVAEIQKVRALLGQCGNAGFDALETQLRQASDIMTDGTQDPTKTCDGISMGLGFEMKAAQIGDVGPPTPAGNACQ